jgi:hypothetical protein
MANACRYLESWCSGASRSSLELLHPLIPVQLSDMVEGKELFRHIHDQKGRYDAKLHVAEMIALIGSPPPGVIQRYQYMRECSWPKPVRQEDGRVSQTAEEYFCGPFFDNNGITGFLSRTNYSQTHGTSKTTSPTAN